MEYLIETGKKPLLMEVDVEISGNQKCQIVIFDAQRRNTVYTNRIITTDKNYTFKIPMPLTPEYVKVYCNCKVKNIARKRLPRKFRTTEIMNYSVRSFVQFAEEFSEKAGNLKTNRKYTSDDGLFNIEFYDSIPNTQTPARIRANDGHIELSASKIVPTTVYERFATLLHEYCHVYKNNNPADEEEADKNSLFVFLGLGYPRYEAYKCWLGTFARARNGAKLSEPHKQRLEQIKKIIDTFDDKFQTITFIQ